MSELYNQAQENFYVDRGLTPLPQPHLTGMKLKGDIVLGDFTFNTIDEYGVTWVITDIEGWWAHPEPDMPDIPRGFGDGSYDVKGRYQARMLTLSGTFLTPTPDLVEAARDRLIAATDLVYKGAWLKTGTDGKRSSFVRLSGAPQIETVSARGRTDFTIGLKAADPIKYSWNDQEPDGFNIVEIPARNRISGSTGLETITNLGTVAVPVQLEIQGPITAPAYIITNKDTANEKLLAVVSGLRGRLTSSVINKELKFNETTLQDELILTTRSAHEFLLNDEVDISGLSEEFLNGTFIVSEVPSSTTVEFIINNPPVASIKNTVSKKLISNVATIETATNHGFNVSDSIFVSGVDSVFDGTYVIASKTDTTFSYAKSRNTAKAVTGKRLSSNVAILTTSVAHGFIVGDQVTVSVSDVNYDGTYEVTDIPSSTEFSYSATRTNTRTTTNKSMANDIATITTAAAHGLVKDEFVSVFGVDNTFDGTRIQVASIPTPTTFTYNIIRPTEVPLGTRFRNGGVATFVTRSTSDNDTSVHGFLVGEKVIIKGGVGNATYPSTGVVTAVDSLNSFSIANAGQPDEGAISITTAPIPTAFVSKKYLSSKQLIGGIATIFTSTAHAFLVGEQVTISGLGTAFDGTYPIASIPFSNAFTYIKPGTNSPLSVAGPTVATRARTGSLATIVTSSAHNLTNGQYVNITNMDSPASALNGTYTITVVNATTFTYTTPTTGTIASAAGSASTVIRGAFAEVYGTVFSVADSGFFTASGTINFTEASGSATVSGDILESDASGGVAVKKNDIVFSPGLTGASIDFGPDLLEVNTLNKDVSLNGATFGGRAKLEVFTDFFFLEVGTNTLEFYDSSDSASNALLKVYYRSGWLG
jgi:hypothetical protein